MKREVALLKIILDAIYENQDWTVIYLPPRITKGLYSCFYILDDLEVCKKYVNEIDSIIADYEGGSGDGKLFVAEGLWHSLIAIYGRCFNSNGSGFIKLEEGMYNDKPDLLVIHKELMEIRNSFVAHRDDTFRFESAVFLLANQAITSKPKFVIKTRRTRFDKEDLPKYSLLLEYAITKVEESLKKYQFKIIKKLLDTGAEEILNEADKAIKNLFQESGNDVFELTEEIIRFKAQAKI